MKQKSCKYANAPELYLVPIASVLSSTAADDAEDADLKPAYVCDVGTADSSAAAEGNLRLGGGAAAAWGMAGVATTVVEASELCAADDDATSAADGTGAALRGNGAMLGVAVVSARACGVI